MRVRLPALLRRLQRVLARDPRLRSRLEVAASATSALAALIAGWVAIALGAQLRDLRQQREGAARPYLAMRGALAVRGSDWLGVTLENIGTGPALGIQVEGRLIEEPRDWPDVPDWYTRQMVRAAFANEEDRPHPFGDLHAIAAGQIGTVWFYGAWAASEDRAGVLYFLGAHVTYHDLFDNRIDAGRDGELWAAITYPEV